MGKKRFAEEDLLVGTGWVIDHLGNADVRLVEVTPPGSGYAFGHLPGAVYLNLDEVFTGRASGVPGTIGPVDEVVAVLGRLGLEPAKKIVVYDQFGGTRAAWAFWLLEYLGFPHVSVLEGGIERWLAEGRPMTRIRPNFEPATFAPALHPERLATAEWIASRLQDREVVLLDCRTPEEYAQGHIPGARNRSWEKTLTLRAYQTFRAADELKTEFAELGATADKEIVTYCGIGERSSHTYLALRLLGYPRVRNYDGSWTDWEQKMNSAELRGTL